MTKKAVRYAAAHLAACAVITGCVLFLMPAYYASDAQRSILREYVSLYCRDRSADRERRIYEVGQMATASRLLIREGLGAEGLAALARCKFQRLALFVTGR